MGSALEWYQVEFERGWFSRREASNMDAIQTVAVGKDRDFKTARDELTRLIAAAVAGTFHSETQVLSALV
jgi:hypothetical protein